MVKRNMNPKSLENLKMGSVYRNKGKQRVTLTLTPETIAFLKSKGNMSEAIDWMVDKVLKGKMRFERD